MNYTIISANDYQTGQIIDIVKNASIYNIEFTDKEQFIMISFKSKEEAIKQYLKIIKCFINGVYSFEDRIKIIKNEIDF